MKIMGATTVMGVIMIVWCLATLAMHPEKAHLPPDRRPTCSVKIDPRATDPRRRSATRSTRSGSSAGPRWATPCGRGNIHWLSLIGVIGILIAFGHSILAMSGEETLAQVYREVESPKLKNFKKAAFVVFLYSMLLTSLISFFAVMIIPDDVRISKYAGNLIGGLAMNVVGPHWARLALNVLVVGVGFLILSGAVNTSIVGSNGVLNRVAEDGVLPDWFLKPHPRYGTTYRLLNMVVALQVVHDRRQPGQDPDPGRGVRLRRGLELRVQGAVDAGAAVQAAGPPRVRGAAELPGRQVRRARWASP